MKAKNILLSILVIALVIVLEGIVMGYYQKTIEVVKNPIVTMEMEGYGNVTIELYPDKAPNTVANFIKLINDGFYNGLTFNVAQEGSYIQGGAPSADSTDDNEFALYGEFYANGYKGNNLRHEAGVLSMYRVNYGSFSPELTTEGYNSASTQFFILDETLRHFDGLYAGFGKVIEGQDIIDQLTRLPHATDENGNSQATLADPAVITKMTVETYGVDYGEPERMEAFDYYSWMMKQYGTSM